MTLERAEPAGDWWKIALTPEEVQAWLGVLNDTRLVLGTRLGVTEEERELDPADPQAGAYAMYHWLTWLQGDLVEALGFWARWGKTPRACASPTLGTCRHFAPGTLGKKTCRQHAPKITSGLGV